MIDGDKQWKLRVPYYGGVLYRMYGIIPSDGHNPQLRVLSFMNTKPAQGIPFCGKPPVPDQDLRTCRKFCSGNITRAFGTTRYGYGLHIASGYDEVCIWYVFIVRVALLFCLYYTSLSLQSSIITKREDHEM